MGRGLKKKLVLSLGLIASILTILSLIVIAGCSNTLMDDVLEKIEEDKIADIAAATYTVTYDGNGSDGGTVPTDSNTYVEGASVTILGSGSMSKSGGYTFIGWNTEPDGGGTARGITDIFSMGASDVTFYAQWTDLDTYNVYYSGNGNDDGTIPMDDNAYVEGAMVTVLGNPGNLEKTDNSFGGWNRQDDGFGTNYTEGETFTIGSADVDLYAKWTESQTITFDKNDVGAEGTMAEQVINSGASADLTICSFTKTGWTFAGWATTEGGSITYADGASYTMGSVDVFLYAKWTPPDNYAIGDRGPGGGIVFYITDGGIHGLESAASDQSTDIEWGGYGTDINGDNSSIAPELTSVGTGSENTVAIVNALGSGTYAARLCYDLVLNDYDDWFLPSKDELDLMYEQKGVIGGFADERYWSSSEVDSGVAWRQFFYSGYLGGAQDSFFKSYSYRVRAVRAF